MDFWEKVVVEQDRLRRSTLILAQYPVLEDYTTLRYHLIELSLMESTELLKAERHGMNRADIIDLLTAHIKAIK